MGSWNETIYGNDSAIDTLGNMQLSLEQGISGVDIIVTELEKYYEHEQMLVLADFDLFLNGKITVVPKVLYSIKRLLDDINLWANPKSRETELLNFKRKVLDNKESHNLNRSNDEIKDWILDRRKYDIFYTCGN